MSSVTEKARFYLERTVPQLREWEEHNIFTKDEIRAIVKKRNDFEHRVLAPRNQPSHFTAYATYERALLSLLARRLKRMHVRDLRLGHTFSARPAAILQRGVDRHPSSPQLWRAYLAECAAAPQSRDRDGKGGKRRRSTKRWRTAITRALRLMPTDAELWVMAGQRAVADGDWEGARGTFMRACRFCTSEGGEEVWLEFAKCEMQWLEKMEKKTKKASGGTKTLGEVAAEDGDGDQILFDSDDDSDDEDGGNFILPEPGRKDAVAPPPIPELEESTNTPAMSGAIPRSVFDVSTKQPFFTPALGRQFFALFAAFRCTVITRSTTESLVQHVVDSMARAYPGDPESVLCFVMQPIEGMPANTIEFVQGLREMLARLFGNADERKVKEDMEGAFREKMAGVVDRWLGGEMDDAVRKVLEDVKMKMGKTTSN